MDDYEMSMQQVLCWQPQIRLTRCDIRNSLKFITKTESFEEPMKTDESPQRYLYQSDSHESDNEDDANQFLLSSSLSHRVSSYHPSEEDRRQKQESLERCKSKLGKKKRSRNSSSTPSYRSIIKKFNDYEFARLGRPKNSVKFAKNLSSVLEATKNESEATCSTSFSKPEAETTIKNEASGTSSSFPSPPLPLKEPVHEIKVEPVLDIRKKRLDNNNGSEEEVPASEQSVTETKITVETTVIPPLKKFLRIKTPDEVNEAVSSYHDAIATATAAAIATAAAAVTSADTKTAVDTRTAVDTKTAAATATAAAAVTSADTTTAAATATTTATATATIAPFNVNNNVPSVFQDEIEIMKMILEEMLCKYYRFSNQTRVKKKPIFLGFMKEFCKTFKQIINSNPDSKLGENVLFEVVKNIDTKYLNEPLSIDMYDHDPEMRIVFPPASLYRVLHKIANRNNSAGDINSLPPPTNNINNLPSRKNHRHQPSANRNSTTAQAQSTVPRAAGENTQSQMIVPQASLPPRQSRLMVSQAVHSPRQSRPMVSQAAHLPFESQPMVPQVAHPVMQFQPRGPQAAHLNTQPQSVRTQVAQLSTRSQITMPPQTTYQPQSMRSNGTEHWLESQHRHNMAQRNSAHPFYTPSNVPSSYPFQSQLIETNITTQRTISYAPVANTFHSSTVSNYVSPATRPINMTNDPRQHYFSTSTRAPHAPSSEFPMPSNAMDVSLSNSSSFSTPRAINNDLSVNTAQRPSSATMERLDHENQFEETQRLLRDFYSSLSNFLDF